MAGNDVILNIGANTASAERQIQQMISRSQAVAGKQSFKMTLDGRGFNQPLGRITSNLNQFQGAMDASIARTLAFGASVAVIGGVAKAFKDLVGVTVSVEKSLKDINVLLQLSTKDLAGFSKELFGVAKNTASSFDTVSVAATEFSRQGLGAAETARRVNDALILARLSGLDAAVAVSTLTAAVNGFAREAVTTTEVVNRLANVDAAFAVSSGDLAAALSRAGSVSQDAKVKFNELLAATTAVQQATARGGNVIGNGFKTIFTRLQRSKVREELEKIGVATTDSTGSIRGAINILKDYAKVYQTLSDQQKAYTSEQIAGVFQINTLKALVNDLSNDFGVYSQALAVANQTTDEAITRNAALNQTLSALANQTGTELQQLAASIGGIAFEDNFKGILGVIKGALGGLNKLVDSDSLGGDLAKGVIRGFGAFITGPGLALVLIGVTKLLTFIGRETAVALKQVLAIGSQAQKRQVVQERIIALLREDTSLLSQIFNSSGKVADVNKLVMASIKAQNIALMEQKVLVASIASAFAVNKAGMVVPRGGKGRGAAGGFIPNLVQQEKTNISRGVGGARAGDKPVLLPNFNMGGGKRGLMVAHTGEHIVPNFARGGSAIFNRSMAASMGLPAGAQRLGAAGYVPNFNKVTTARKAGAPKLPGAATLLKSYPDQASLDAAVKSGKITMSGTSYVFPDGRGGTVKLAPSQVAPIFKAKGAKKKLNTFNAMSPQGAFMAIPGVGGAGKAIEAQFLEKRPVIGGVKIDKFKAMAYGINPNPTGKSSGVIKSLSGIDKKLDNAMIVAANNILRKVTGIPAIPSQVSSSQELKSFLQAGGWGGVQAAKGGFFEGIISAIVDGAKAGGVDSDLDIVLNPGNKKLLRQIFNLPRTVLAGDFKVNAGQPNVRTFARQAITAKHAGLIGGTVIKGAAGGFIPSFANLSELQNASRTPAGQRALKTERALAGSAKMGFDSRVGFGVYNNSQGSLSRAISQHVSSGDSVSSLSTMGASAQQAVNAVMGYIPNFAPIEFKGAGVHGGGVSGTVQKEAKVRLAAINSAYKKLASSTTLNEKEVKALTKEIGKNVGYLKKNGIEIEGGSKIRKQAQKQQKRLIQKRAQELARKGGYGGAEQAARRENVQRLPERDARKEQAARLRVERTRRQGYGGAEVAARQEHARRGSFGGKVGRSMKGAMKGGSGIGAYMAGSMIVGQLRQQASKPGRSWEQQKGLEGAASVGQGALTGLMVAGPWGALAGALAGGAKAIWDFTDSVGKSASEFAKISSKLEGTKTAASNYAAALAAIKVEKDPLKKADLFAKAAEAKEKLSPEIAKRLDVAAGGKEGALGKQLQEEQAALAIKLNEAKIKHSLAKFNVAKEDYIREFFKNPSKARIEKAAARKELVGAGAQLAARTEIETEPLAQKAQREKFVEQKARLEGGRGGPKGYQNVLENYGVDLESAGVTTEEEAKALFEGFGQQFAVMLQMAAEATVTAMEQGVKSAREAIAHADVGKAMDLRKEALQESGYGGVQVKQEEGFRKRRQDLIKGHVKNIPEEMMDDETKKNMLDMTAVADIYDKAESGSRSNVQGFRQNLMKEYEETEKIDTTTGGGQQEQQKSVAAINKIQLAQEQGNLIDEQTGRVNETLLGEVTNELGKLHPVTALLKGLSEDQNNLLSATESELELLDIANKLLEEQTKMIVNQLIKNASGKEMDFEGIDDAIKFVTESKGGGVKEVGKRAAAYEHLADKYEEMGLMDKSKESREKGQENRRLENAMKSRGMVTETRGGELGPLEDDVLRAPFEEHTGPEAISKTRQDSIRIYSAELAEDKRVREEHGIDPDEKLDGKGPQGTLSETGRAQRKSHIEYMKALEKADKATSPEAKAALQKKTEDQLDDAYSPNEAELEAIDRMSTSANVAAIMVALFADAAEDAAESLRLVKESAEAKEAIVAIDEGKDSKPGLVELKAQEEQYQKDVAPGIAARAKEREVGYEGFKEKLEKSQESGKKMPQWVAKAEDWSRDQWYSPLTSGAIGDAQIHDLSGQYDTEEKKREYFARTPEGQEAAKKAAADEQLRLQNNERRAAIENMEKDRAFAASKVDAIGSAGDQPELKRELDKDVQAGAAAAELLEKAETRGDNDTELLKALNKTMEKGNDAIEELRKITSKEIEADAAKNDEDNKDDGAKGNEGGKGDAGPSGGSPVTASIDIKVDANGTDADAIANELIPRIEDIINGMVNDGAGVTAQPVAVA